MNEERKRSRNCVGIEFSGIVVEVGLLLGLHLQNGVHVVLVRYLGGVASQSDHTLFISFNVQNQFEFSYSLTSKFEIQFNSS